MKTRVHDEIVLRDLREQEWFWVQNELLDHFAPRIGADAVCVYLSLARMCYGRRPILRVSLRQIETQWRSLDGDALIGKSTISRALRRLVETGMIRKLEEANGSRPAEYGLVSLQKLARKEPEIPSHPGTKTREKETECNPH